MTWLATQYIWILMVVAPGGLTSQHSIHTTPEACEAARETVERELPKNLVAGQEDLGLRAECRARVRSTYR